MVSQSVKRNKMDWSWIRRTKGKKKTKKTRSQKNNNDTPILMFLHFKDRIPYFRGNDRLASS